jgi:hypothetical protein
MNILQLPSMKMMIQASPLLLSWSKDVDIIKLPFIQRYGLLLLLYENARARVKSSVVVMHVLVIDGALQYAATYNEVCSL